MFNGKGSGQPAFVTPRVNAATSRRSSQGEGQTGKVSLYIRHLLTLSIDLDKAIFSTKQFG